MEKHLLSDIRGENLRSSGFFDSISCSECLSNLRQRNLNRLLLAHININSIRNKFDQLVSSIKNNIDILMISETKIDNSFPTMQFHIEGYCIYRLDRNEYGGGILVYVREDIPSRFIPMPSSSIESFFIELNLRCKKWYYEKCPREKFPPEKCLREKCPPENCPAPHPRKITDKVTIIHTTTAAAATNKYH